MGNHAAEGEADRRRAERVDESIVPLVAIADASDQRSELRLHHSQPRLQRRDAALVARRNVAPTNRCGPHLLGEDDALEHGPHVGFGALEVMNDQPRADVPIKGVVGERRGLLQQSRGVPVVMLDEAVGEIHGRCPRLAWQQ